MAPESIGMKEYSPASDAWMFGILCVEIWTETQPHPELDNLDAALRIRNEGLHPHLPETMPEWLKDICINCWSIDPRSRPTMSEIVRLFKANRTK